MNTRPSDFPSDSELDEAQPLTTLTALFDAFIGSPEWDEHDVRTRLDATVQPFWVMGAEDCQDGILFAPEAYFVPGSAQYNAYCAGWYEAAQR